MQNQKVNVIKKEWEKQASAFAMGLFALASVLAIVYQLWQGDILLAAKGLLFLPFMLFPLLFRAVRIRHPYRLYILLYLFMIFAFSYGCIYGSFGQSAVTDKISHFASGTIFTIIGFCLYYWQAPMPPQQAGKPTYALRSESRPAARLAWQFALFFSMFIAAIWEIAEFFDFNVFGNDSQNHLTTGVFDTMQDLIACLAATVLSILAFMLYRKKGVKLLTAWVVEEFYNKNAGKKAGNDEPNHDAIL